MAVRANGFFNSPQFAQAASNLAGLFEPPSGSDASGWALANAKNAEAARQAEVYAQAKSGATWDMLDRLGFGAGMQTGGQTLEAVDRNNASALQLQYAKPVIVGQDQRAYLPAQAAAASGLPGVLAGKDSPLSETQAKAQDYLGLSQDLRDAITFGNTAVETVSTPEGPRIQTRLDALGEAPAPKEQGAGMSVTLKDGTVVQVGGKTTDAQDRAGFSGAMAGPATEDLLAAYDTNKLPTAGDFALESVRSWAPRMAAPLLASGMSEEGQTFYQNLRSALPFQLMTQSGAAVTEQEYERKLAELVPVPGEAKGVTLAKRRQLEIYLRAVGAMAGPAKGIQDVARESGNPAAVPAAVDQTSPAAPVAPSTVDAVNATNKPLSPDAEKQLDGKIITNGSQKLIRKGGKWVPYGG